MATKPKRKNQSQTNHHGSSRMDSVRKDTNPRNAFSNQQRLEESVDMRGAKRIAAPRDRANDPAWYSSAVDLRSSYFSYPFNAPLGRPFQSGDHYLDDSSVPGVMAYYYVPTVGVATSATSAINVAAQRIYSYVRYENSGHANYDPTDLMIYILAMDSLEMYAMFLQRLYGMLLKYTPVNWYAPEAMIKAQFVNPTDLAKHIPDLYGYIKLFVAKVSALSVPASVSYNARHAWLTSRLWVDSKDSSKAQTYMFVPQSYLKFGLDSTGAGQLVQTRLFDVAGYIGDVNDDDLLTFDQLVAFGNALLEPVISQEDFGIMSGDILKAYKGNVRSITMIPQDYVVPFDYSEEVMSQIENATVWSGAVNVNVTQVNPTPGVKAAYLQSQPSVEMFWYVIDSLSTQQTNGLANAMRTVMASGYSYQYSKMLNFHHDNPSPDEVAVATRLMTQCIELSAATPVQRTSGYTTWVLQNRLYECGSEIIVGARMFFNVASSDNSSLVLKAYDVPTVLPISIKLTSSFTAQTAMAAPAFIADRVEQLATFDWHHGVYLPIVTYNIAADPGAFSTHPADGIAIDADMFTWVDGVNVANMHRAALLNELWIPV